MSGKSRFRIEVDGYQPSVLRIEAQPLVVERVRADLVPTFGRLEISVANARTVGSVPAAVVTVDGAALPAGSSDTFVARVAAGEHSLTVEATGFCAAEKQVLAREREVTKVVIPISPVLENGQRARTILDWAENPRDLDAHVLLSGNSVDIDSPHIYFSKKQGRVRGGEVFAELDVDYVHSEGYETITIYDQADGVYQYFVHLFSGTGALGTSDARVEVLTAGCKRKVYPVPRQCTDRWWYVADLKVSAGEVLLLDRDECLGEEPLRWRTRGK
jgi:uncharacterized protein YfaP (DUF2135 family)